MYGSNRNLVKTRAGDPNWPGSGLGPHPHEPTMDLIKYWYVRPTEFPLDRWLLLLLSVVAVLSVVIMLVRLGMRSTTADVAPPHAFRRRELPQCVENMVRYYDTIPRHREEKMSYFMDCKLMYQEKALREYIFRYIDRHVSLHGNDGHVHVIKSALKDAKQRCLRELGIIKPLCDVAGFQVVFLLGIWRFVHIHTTFIRRSDVADDYNNMMNCNINRIVRSVADILDPERREEMHVPHALRDDVRITYAKLMLDLGDCNYDSDCSWFEQVKSHAAQICRDVPDGGTTPATSSASVSSVTSSVLGKKSFEETPESSTVETMFLSVSMPDVDVVVDLLCAWIALVRPRFDQDTYMSHCGGGNPNTGGRISQVRCMPPILKISRSKNPNNAPITKFDKVFDIEFRLRRAIEFAFKLLTAKELNDTAYWDHQLQSLDRWTLDRLWSVAVAIYCSVLDKFVPEHQLMIQKKVGKAYITRKYDDAYMRDVYNVSR